MSVSANDPWELEVITSVLKNVFSKEAYIIKYEPLSGGLTNVNYVVDFEDKRLVVRISSQDASLLAIDREQEFYNSVAAFKSGAGVPVYGRSLDPIGLVVGFVVGKTLSSMDLRDPRVLERIVASCTKLHSGPSFNGRFNMFEIQRGYLRIVQERGFRLPQRYLSYLEKVTELERAMTHKPERLVPCNNDLLAENFIDDGDRIWIIDYEYSGNNEPSFELGNIWSESNLDEASLVRLVELYYGVITKEKVARARAWGLMSKYGWTLWASIQQAIATIDFDFWEWGMEKYVRAEEELNSPIFRTILSDLGS